jgi:hypothetical protein
MDGVGENPQTMPDDIDSDLSDALQEQMEQRNQLGRNVGASWEVNLVEKQTIILVRNKSQKPWKKNLPLIMPSITAALFFALTLITTWAVSYLQTIDIRET